MERRAAGVAVVQATACARPGRFIYLHGHASSAELTYFLHANPATRMTTTTTTTTTGRSATWAFIIAGQGLNGGFARDPRQSPTRSDTFIVYQFSWAILETRPGTTTDRKCNEKLSVFVGLVFQPSYVRRSGCLDVLNTFHPREKINIEI